MDTMNRLSVSERAKILQLMTEGISIRAISRLTGHHKTTILSFLVEAGTALAIYQDKTYRNLPCKRVQIDEIWSFAHCKEQNKEKAKSAPPDAGDTWTWTSICADTKLVPCWLVADRTLQSARRFITDLSERMANRIQLTSDGYKPYAAVIEGIYGNNGVDYGQIQKQYDETKKRGKFGAYTGAIKTTMLGNPDPAHISTAYCERMNLNIRMETRRMTRKTNAFSKKVANHAHAMAIYFMCYNFCRIHQTLRVTPAMAAKITDRVWSYEDVINVIDREKTSN